MRLAFKLIFALVASVVALLAVEAYVSVERARAQFEEDMAHELGILGRALGAVVQDTWHREGSARALELVARADAGEPAIVIRWVWLQPTLDADRKPIASKAQLEPARVGEPLNITVVTASGSRTMVAYTPVELGGEWRGAIEMAEPMASAEQHERRAWWRAASLTALVAIIGGVLIAVLGVRWGGRPLQALINKTRRVAEGDLTTPVRLETNDELQTLGNELDSMSLALVDIRRALKEEADSRVRTVEQLRHADRLTTVGTLAAGVAHELGTPLNVISGHAGLLMADTQDEDTVEALQIIKDQAVRMTGIIQGLLEFARRKPASVEQVAVIRVIALTVDLLRPLASKHRGKLELGAVDEQLDVRADPGQLQQVLSNLIINGLQSRDGGATVTVHAQSVVATPPPEASGRRGDYARIQVRDNGAGISATTIEHLFEPFFTTKTVGEGTGLGLSIAHGLVAEQGGWIDVSSEIGHGTCFSVYLPRSDKAPTR